MQPSLKIASRYYWEQAASRVLASVAIYTLCLFGATVESARAQPQHVGHDAAGPVPREILERPLPLRQGVGKVHEAVTTSAPEAQAFYDQGLAYLNSFVWIEAARSFHQALRLDPHLGMAQLGLSDAYVGLQELPEALDAFQKAQSLAERMSDRERARLTIRARQLDYLQNSGDMQKYFAYRQSVADALALSPEDPWLWILRGFADEGSPLAHGQGGGVDTIAFYETALKFSPDSFVAHHYLAHTLENHGPAKRALAETQTYVRMAPAIPHAHHMVGHNLRRLGRTEDAIQEFLKALELENAYYRVESIPPRYDWHHAHNLQLLGLSYQSLGQMKSAEAALRAAFSLPASIDLAEFNRRAWPQFLLDRERPQEALEAAQEMIAKSEHPMGRLAGQSLAGQAYLAMNRLQEAKSSLAQAEQEMEQLPAAIVKLLPDAGLLHAEIMLYEKNWSKGNILIEKLEEEMIAVPGPDAWSEALFQLESIEKIARRVGDWDLVGQTAQKMIQHDPSYAGGYFALGWVAEHEGDTSMARQKFAAAEKLWSKADADVRSTQMQNR
jgi:tetratricopeptide (TPR) repeat protein